MEYKKFPYLFSEGNIGNITCRNRIVMPAMETNFAEETGEVNDRVVSYYERRAKGGVGLIIIEGACIAKEGKGFKNDIGIDGDHLIPGLKKLVNAVKRYGAKIAIQLLHAGRQTKSKITGLPIVAPSAIACSSIRDIPVALTKNKIIQIENQYADAARRAKESGFDSIEVHGAHGYLIHQFLSPLSNKRKDVYGGSKKGRLRFALEVLKKIRSAVGDDYPVIFRISAKEFIDGGIDLPLSTYYCKELNPWVQAIHVSSGAYGSETWMVQPYSHEPGLLVPFAGHIKKEIDIPVITVGRIHSPKLANKVIAEENADFIAIGRALIADPDLPVKAEKGDTGEIWNCLSCNIGCVDRLSLQYDAACLVNPWMGKESVITDKMDEAKICLICGGGPSGISAAVGLAERGAKVILAERNKIGGQLNLAARIPSKKHFTRLIERYIRRLEELGVEVVKLKANINFVKKVDPQLVVLATGSVPNILTLPGLNNIKHMTYVEAFDEEINENNIIIIGGGATGCELAEYLLNKGKTVTIVDKKKQLASELNSMRKILLAHLNKLALKIYTNTEVVQIKKSCIILKKNRCEKILLKGVSCLIFACGVKPTNQLGKELTNAGIDFVSIGDCRKPQNAFWAIREGFETALKAFPKS